MKLEKILGKKGFTLVETVIVSGIVVGLAAATLGVIHKAKEKIVNKTNYSLNQLMTAISAYQLGNNDKYPEGDPCYNGDIIPLLEQIDLDTEKFSKDEWGNNFVYFPSQNYPSAPAVKGPPISGYYNPRTYQLFSKGKDGYYNSNASCSENKDNIWVLGGQYIVPFKDAKDNPGM